MYWNKTWLVIVLAFLAFNLLVLNHSISLWDEDEAAYAGFGQQMLATGDWVNPDYQWSTIHRKPPFHFWTVTISFSIFGVNEFALRLPGALAIWLTCFLLWRWGRYVFGEERAGWAAAILSSSVLVPLYGKVAFTDATLLLFQTTAALGLLNYLYKPHWYWNVVFWASVALGVLTKGPPILILVGGLWFWLLVFHPQRRNLVGTHPWIFLPISLLPFGAWMYLSWQRDGGAMLAFLYDFYILKRVGGSVLGQSGPPGYHLVVLLISFFVWIPFLLMAVAQRLKNWRQWQPESIAIAGIMVFGWLFFEAMSSKLPSYALAAQPAWALVIAGAVMQSQPDFPRLFKVGIVFQTVLWLGVVGAAVAAGYWLAGADSLWVSGTLVLVALLAGGYMLRHLWGGHRFAGIYTNLFALSLLTMLFNVVGNVIEPSPIKSIKTMAQQAADWTKEKPNTNLYYTELHIKQKKISFPVYLSRYFGTAHQEVPPDSAITLFRQPQPAVFIIGDGSHFFFDGLQQAGISLAPSQIDSIAWRSTDDQLRLHPFILVKNW